MVNKLYIFFSIILISSCAISADGFNIEVTEITSSGVDGERAGFCSDFNLSIDEAQNFFNESELVSAEDIHNHFSVLPCFVSGVAELNNQICLWTVRAGGTGNIKCEAESYLHACDDCLPTP